MCGIWFAKVHHKKNSALIQHRGPDTTTTTIHNEYAFVFHRLAINDLTPDGNQPLCVNDTILMCNGEIYNHGFLKSELTNNVHFIGQSDCEPVVHMLDTNIDKKFICNSLDGVFAIVAMKGDVIFAARDPIGVRPLYYGIDSDDGSLAFASEVKGLQSFCEIIQEFPKGHYYTSETHKFHCYNKIASPVNDYISYNPQTLKVLLESSVKKRLMSERPIGFFLSGGLDSSLISAIGAKYLGQIETFSIGIGDSPDLKAAKIVSDHIGSKHTEISFTAEEGLDILRKVIYSLETYDCTTIRASVPMYILSQYVSKNTNCKVILSGEGADELFGGYLFFHNAPSDQEFQNETLKLIDNVHAFDVLRADRCTASHGIELRVPFFDKALIQYVKSIHPKHKLVNTIEKNILRLAFDDDEQLLPESILWRQKNGMSDAVGYSWVDFMKNHAEKTISDDIFISQSITFQKNKPLSKEELLYRNIYCSLFPTIDNLPYVWRPSWSSEIDPSATLLKNHTK